MSPKWLLLFVAVLVNQVVLEVDGLKCHQGLTEPLEGQLSRGTLIAAGHTYTTDYFEAINQTHFNVCVCHDAKNCLRRCCPLGKIFNEEDDCIPSSRPSLPLILNLTENGVVKPNTNLDKKFHNIHARTCDHGNYQAEESDNPILFSNGSLFTDDEWRDVEGFCVENKLVDETLEVVIHVCYPDPEIHPEPSIAYPIGMIISIPFLLATLLVYCLIPELRNLHGKCLICHVSSLIVGYFFLVLIQLKVHMSPTTCVASAFIVQFGFLASFFWLNIMSIDIWWAFSGYKESHRGGKTRERTMFLVYSAYAWGCSVIILIVSLIMHHAPNLPPHAIVPGFGVESCFFSTEVAKLAYFYGPIAVILVCNLVLFVATAYKIFIAKQQTQVKIGGKDSKTNTEDNKQRFFLYLKLFIVMGVNWMWEIISWALPAYKEVFVITDIINSLQGVLIFFIFVWRKRTLVLIKKKLGWQTKNSDSSATNNSISKTQESAMALDSLQPQKFNNPNNADESDNALILK